MFKIKPLKKKIITFTIAGFLFANPIFVQADLGDQVLKKGMNHEDVKILQQHLINLNYLELEETTTYYGDQTIEAVMDFQSSQGLKADGTFGSDSFKALQNLLQLKPLTYNRILKEDVSGEDVQALQERLKILRFLDIDNCTTYFGSETRQALMDFQKTYGIKADGIAGAETIQAINDALNGNRRKLKSSANRGGSRNSSLGENIISTAKKYMGTSYSYGSSNSNAFDCSGFTQYIYKQHGINIPRSSVEQATVGNEVSKENLQIGDLVIFKNTYKSGPSHAGIYIGNGDFIHSSSAGGGVIISNLNSGYYSNHFGSGRRVFQ
jgi:cell wall-associated NlpC family hydrolase